MFRFTAVTACLPHLFSWRPKHLAIVTQKWFWYININFYSIKPFSTTVGKLGELNVRTNVLVGFIIQSRRTVFLRTSVTPSAQGWTAEIPFDVFGDEWVLRSILDYKMFSSLSRLFSCDSLAHCIKSDHTLEFSCSFLSCFFYFL